MRTIVVRKGKISGRLVEDGIYLVEIKGKRLVLSRIEFTSPSKLGIELSPEDVDHMIVRGATA
ncbi:MAG: hypothetical protein QXO55_00560 [Candidatus Korarchaeum sp.]